MKNWCEPKKCEKIKNLAKKFNKQPSYIGN